MLAIRPVQQEQPAGELRGRLRGDLEFGQINPAAAEQGIGQGFPEVLDPTQLFALPEMVDADPQHVAQPLEDGGRQRPLVALDLVQVAGRKAHRLAKRRLAHPGAFPQPAQLRAGKQLRLAGAALQNSQFALHRSPNAAR